MSLSLAPCDFDVAANFVRQHHRHHTPPQGHKFSLAAMRGDKLVGVAIIGRPVARKRQDGLTLEITRLCVRADEPAVIDRNGKEHAPAACSFLYGAAWRAALALGYRRLGTYVLKREGGTSLRAAGYYLVRETPGKSWSVPSRVRDDKHPIEPKLLFERTTHD